LSGVSSSDSVGGTRFVGATDGGTRIALGSGGVCTVVMTINHTMFTATARPTGVCAGANLD
jgi:hypothetical protein